MTKLDPGRPDRRAFVAGGLLSLVGASRAGAARGVGPSGVRTLVAVRHAEKALEPADDPGLTAQGIARAEALAALLGHAGVTHLVASEYRRTQETLGPLAATAEVAIDTHPARDVKGLARRATTAPVGSVIVVAGHSNTVPALVKALGGDVRDLDERGFLDESSYDRLFVVTLVAGPDEESAQEAGTIELRYGG